MAKSPSPSGTDWLANSLLFAKTIAAAAECAPFPYLKGVFGTVVVLLETVEVCTPGLMANTTTFDSCSESEEEPGRSQRVMLG
jgi:hypothetical protein